MSQEPGPAPEAGSDRPPSPGSAQGAAGAPRGRMVRLKVVALALMAVLLVLDLLSKQWLQDALVLRPGRNGEREIDVIPGFFALQGTWNPGVTFGIARGYTWQILVLTGTATLALLTWLLATRNPSRLLHVGLGLIISGALGNLYDRLRWSEVRDYFLVYLGRLDAPDWTWPNFNVADAAIVVGVSLVIWDSLFTPDPAKAPRA
ncbi:MAG: signal peptidase II [Planctomycetia bacterium]